MRRARIRTCVKSKCEGYGSYLLVLACGMWDWAFGLYLRLAAEVEDFCNPAREHGTPGEHALVIMTVAQEHIHANAAHLRVLHPCSACCVACSALELRVRLV